MAWRQRHQLELADVPGAHENAARIGVAPDQIDRATDLIDRLTVRRGPRAPLPTVDGSELTVLIGPFVPNRNAVVLQVLDVRVAAQEPQKLVDDGAQVQLLRRDERKALRQIEPHLMTEHGQRTGPRAVGFRRAVLANMTQ